MSKSSNANMVVFAHVPPPEHGQSRMVETMLEGLSNRDVEVIHVDARVSEEMSDLGTDLIGKMLLMFGYLRQALVAKWRSGAKTLYYIPGPVIWSAVVSDWMVMAVLRLWYRDLILHWHAIGQGEWAHGSERCRLPGPGWLDRVARKVSALLFCRPDLSIAVSPTSDADARAVGSRRIEVVCNGIDDPCPDFEESVIAIRRRRAEEIRDSGAPEIRILFMSHGTVEKGLFDTLSALEKVLGRLDDRVRVSMTIAGGIAENREARFVEELAKFKANPDLSVEIQRLNFVSGQEKSDCFANADLFVAASRWESFGLTVLEAMAWGLPVVAAASDGVKGILSEEYEWMAPTANPERLAEKLEMGVNCVLRGEGSVRGERLRERFMEAFQSECFLNGIRGVLAEHCEGVSVVDDTI